MEAEYFPKSSWAFNGYATPEDTIKSILWAKSIGDYKKFQAGSIPELSRQLENEALKNKTDQEKSAWVIESVKNINGVRIQKKTVLPDGQVALELRFDGRLESGYSIETMTNSGGDWKIAIAEEHYAGLFFRLPALTDAEFAPRAGSVLQGFWTGMIKTGNGGLHVNIKIAEPNAGTFRADFYSLDQGAIRQATLVSFDGTTVKLTPLGTGHGMFQGGLRNRGTEMVGNWVQGGRHIPMTFTRAN